MSSDNPLANKPDFFSELPDPILDAIFLWTPELKTHFAFILTCKAHYAKWKKKLVFQARCFSEHLKISWWGNLDYKDLYENRNVLSPFLVPVYQGGIEWEKDHTENFPWGYIKSKHQRSLFPFFQRKLPSISEENILGFYKIAFTVKDIHQNAIKKPDHYLLEFLKEAEHIESYIDRKKEIEYKNPCFKPSLLI